MDLLRMGITWQQAEVAAQNGGAENAGRENDGREINRPMCRA